MNSFDDNLSIRWGPQAFDEKARAYITKAFISIGIHYRDPATDPGEAQRIANIHKRARWERLERRWLTKHLPCDSNERWWRWAVSKSAQVDDTQVLASLLGTALPPTIHHHDRYLICAIGFADSVTSTSCWSADWSLVTCRECLRAASQREDG